MSFCNLMIVAGNETTTKLLGNALYWLSLNPSERQKVLADHSQIPDWVEENPPLRQLDPTPDEAPSRRRRDRRDHHSGPIPSGPAGGIGKPGTPRFSSVPMNTTSTAIKPHRSPLGVGLISAWEPRWQGWRGWLPSRSGSNASRTMLSSTRVIEKSSLGKRPRLCQATGSTRLIFPESTSVGQVADAESLSSLAPHDGRHHGVTRHVAGCPAHIPEVGRRRR